MALSTTWWNFQVWLFFVIRCPWITQTIGLCWTVSLIVKPISQHVNLEIMNAYLSTNVSTHLRRSFGQTDLFGQIFTSTRHYNSVLTGLTSLKLIRMGKFFYVNRIQTQTWMAALYFCCHTGWRSKIVMNGQKLSIQIRHTLSIAMNFLFCASPHEFRSNWVIIVPHTPYWNSATAYGTFTIRWVFMQSNWSYHILPQWIAVTKLTNARTHHSDHQLCVRVRGYHSSTICWSSSDYDQHEVS